MTQKAVDVLKDLAVYGAGFFGIAYTLVAVVGLANAKVIDGATAMTFLSNIGSASAGFLFGVSLARSTTRAADKAYEKGLNTPTPGSDATVVTGDNPTVQSGGPTVTGDNVRVSTPTVTRP